MPTGPIAVIFDCDGVLVDSEELAWSAWRDVLALFDVQVTDTDVRELTGHSQATVYAAFDERADLPPRDEVLEAVLGATLERFAGDLPSFSDAVTVVQELAAVGMPLGIASSSPRRRLTASLTAIGLERVFDAVVAGDEVNRGKPAPDTYLRAADALGADPRRCVAVEDTPIGVAAAKAAGMRTVAVRRDHVDPGAPYGADLVVQRLSVSALLR